jgi:ATP-dependent RNA helicase DeaD
MNGLNCVTLYGGTNYETQFRALDRGVHVVVGTPGRLMDHIKRGTLQLNHIKTLVLDEADEMLRMGFIDDVEWTLKQVPEQRQILTFSATMPDPIRRISEKYLRNPEHITIKGDSRAADSIEQSFQIVAQRGKIDALARILDTEPTDGVIVFTKTKMTAIVVAEQLERRGYPTAALHGDIAQKHRERSVNQLKSGRVSVLVATDVAARGLDVPRISHVINYDFPHDTETYIHRIGRTGRAGREGVAVLFVEPKEKRKLNRLEHEAKQRIKMFEPCSIKEVNKRRVEKFKSSLFGAMKDKQMTVFQKLFAELIEEQPDYSMEQVAAACAVLAQGSTPLYLDELPSKKRGKADRGKRVDSRNDANKTTYRIEVGRDHGVGPGNIVGAIANEAGLESGDIGRIKLMDAFSLIDLPVDLDAGTLEILYNVNVGSVKLKTRKDEGGPRSNQSPRIKRNNGSTDFVKKRKRKANAGAEGEDKPWKKKSYDSRSAPWKKKSSGGAKPWKKKSSEGSSKPWQKKSKSSDGAASGEGRSSSTSRGAKAGAKAAGKGSKYIKIRSKTKK